MRNCNYDIRRWTKSAIDCYMRGCVCQGCPIYELVFAQNPVK